MLGFPLDSRVTYAKDPDTGVITPKYDRAVTSKPLREYIRGIITTGVLPNPSDNLQVFPGTDGMTVIVHAGFAVVDGGLAKEDNNRTLEVTASDATYDRIDTVVVRWNDNDSVRNVDLYIKQGVPARNPVRPTLTREGSVYEIGLADIFVTKNVRTITAEKITDTRLESSRCGVASSIAKWDTTTIYQQIQSDLAGFKSNEQAEFMTWFNKMKDQLTTDAAGKLQTEVDEVRGQIRTNLLNPTAQTQTKNGVTFTNNGNGTYTVNGTANDTAYYPLADQFTDLDLSREYKIVGCPRGGSENTYMLYDAKNSSNPDTGNGTVYTPKIQPKFYIRISKAATVNNLLFKPMVTTDLDATYDDFVPYTGDSCRLNEDVSNLVKGIGAYIAGQRNPDLLGKGAYIGRKIEGGGTIFFDYAIGFKGDISVAPITENLHSYHVDPLTRVVMCDDLEDTTKQNRFMVVSDYDIGDYKHGNNLMWSNGKSGSLYTVIGTETGFGTGKANTEKCIAAATTDNLIGWNTNAYNCIWHYVSKGDWDRTTDRGTHVWFVPSNDELNVLLNMQWSAASKRKSYDGSTQLIQLPINFYSYYWSSSESSATMVFAANFYNGNMGTDPKNISDFDHVRLVRTF